MALDQHTYLFRDGMVPRDPLADGNYPGLTRLDAEVWTAWLSRDHDPMIHVYYRVLLGGTIIDDPDTDPALAAGWRDNTALKIDVLAVLTDQNLVVELKPVASLGALGQALGYAALLDLDPFNNLPNTPTVIARDASADVRKAAELLGVRLDTLR